MEEAEKYPPASTERQRFCSSLQRMAAEPAPQQIRRAEETSRPSQLKASPHRKAREFAQRIEAKKSPKEGAAWGSSPSCRFPIKQPARGSAPWPRWLGWGIKTPMQSTACSGEETKPFLGTENLKNETVLPHNQGKPVVLNSDAEGSLCDVMQTLSLPSKCPATLALCL